MKFLGFTFIQGSILGFIIAAVSPAVLIPSMVSLIERKIGQDKAIPQMLLVGASADDTIAITLFTTFLGIYIQSNSGENISIATNIISIPITILISILFGFIAFKLSKSIIQNTDNKYLKTMITFFICLSIRFIEKNLEIEILNSLLSIMVYGFFIRNYIKEDAKYILDNMNNIWKYGKLYLFTFVGMAVNPTLVVRIFLYRCDYTNMFFIYTFYRSNYGINWHKIKQKRKIILCYSISSKGNSSICESIYTASNGGSRRRCNAKLLLYLVY